MPRYWRDNPPPPSAYIHVYHRCSCMIDEPLHQLSHSYYFTTPILVLNFVNKGVFFEEIQHSHFPRKMGVFWSHLRGFGEKWVNFDVQCFTGRMKVHLCWKVSVLPQKKGFILDWKSVFYHAKGVILSWKVSVLPQKGGNFQTGEQGWVPLFPVCEGAGPPPSIIYID